MGTVGGWPSCRLAGGGTRPVIAWTKEIQTGDCLDKTRFEKSVAIGNYSALFWLFIFWWLTCLVLIMFVLAYLESTLWEETEDVAS